MIQGKKTNKKPNETKKNFKFKNLRNALSARQKWDTCKKRTTICQKIQLNIILFSQSEFRPAPFYSAMSDDMTTAISHIG